MTKSNTRKAKRPKFKIVPSPEVFGAMTPEERWDYECLVSRLKHFHDAIGKAIEYALQFDLDARVASCDLKHCHFKSKFYDERKKALVYSMFQYSEQRQKEGLARAGYDLYRAEINKHLMAIEGRLMDEVGTTDAVVH